ncbi:MAG: Ig-like domain-containing protein [Methylococcaceae bacterium]|nr:Ig-like domain-containing protein [Methylococcaceae bacterium]
MNGSASNDPDNGPSPLTFAWSQTAGPTISLSGANTATPSFTPTQVDSYAFSLVVSDGKDNSAPASVTITVQPIPNQPPIANAGSNQNVKTDVKVALDGGNSRDPDNGPTPLAYAWSQVSGPGVSLEGANSAKPSFTASEEGRYVFSLVVSDGAANSPAATVAVNASWGIDPPHLKLTVPAVWKLKVPQEIAFKANVNGKLVASFQFSKDGGKKFSTIKSAAIKTGKFSYKFSNKNQMTNQGVIQACVKVPYKVAVQVGRRTVYRTIYKTACDRVNIAVQ